ncbi:MAG TPA: glycoside hydrolase family 3 N-terminal domain-containing protein [Ktedonobacteraceae bacterium]|nr:glycoside hydrolase family 3 N-terminal domain-containing protein [Ktedonobacteraceae bacterium]
MQFQRVVRLPARIAYSHILLMVCCLALLCSGCANVLGNVTSPPSPTAGRSGSASITQSVAQKADANSFSSEELLRMQLAKVQSIMQGMTLDQKLGQLIMVEYLGKSYQGSGLQNMVAQQFVGGFMYQESNHNFDPPYNIAGNVDGISVQAMKDAHVPLLIATDQEGGLVNRLYKFHGYLPSAEAMAASGNTQMALSQGTLAAKWLLELGINADLAPVVDVHTVNPPVLQSRMFGSDPKTVASYAGAYLDGLQHNGVAGCLKHFPGLGAVTSDPHVGLPVVNRSKADLEAIDLAPYRMMIQQDNPGMIMSTDVLMPATDPALPAELSPKVINGVLRGELGYNGVVITDGLYMAGISQRWSLSQASVLAIVAGNDLIEGPFTPAQVAAVVTALKNAIQQGTLSMDRVNQSVQRILLLKAQYGIIK